MKKAQIILIVLFCISTGIINVNNSYGQTANEDRIKVIPTLINAAVEKGDYQTAADLKKEKELRLQIKEALAKDDYQKAGELQKQISSGNTKGNSNKTSALEAELKQAITKEDYKKASEIKKQLEAIKNGVAYTPTNNNGSSTSNNSPSYYQNGISEPEFANQVFYFNKQANVSYPLESGVAELKTSTIFAPGYHQSNSFYTIKGARSSSRFSANTNHSFIVKVSESLDPKEYFYLVKYEVKGKKTLDRQVLAFVTSGTVFAGGSQTPQTDKQKIPILFTKIRDGVYQITPQATLYPGEYAFVYSTNKMFSFGLD